MSEQIHIYETPIKPRMSMKKKVLISSIIVLVIVAIVLIIWFFLYNSAKQQMLRAVKAEDYQLLVELYTDNSNDFDEEVISVLSEKLDCMKTDYISGKADQETIKSNLILLKRINSSAIQSRVDSTNGFIMTIDNSQNNYSKGISAYNSSNFIDAIYYFKLVSIEDNNNYQSAQDKLKESIERYRDLQIAAAEKIANKGDLPKAIALLVDSQELLPDDELLSNKITTYRVQIRNNEIEDILRDAKKEADKGNYQTAITQIENAINKYDNDERLSTKLDDYTTKYVKSIIETVDKLKAKHEYDSAIDVITGALVVFPANSDLSAKLTEVKKDKETYEYNVEKSNLLSQAKKEFDKKNYEKAIEILSSDNKFDSDEEVRAKLTEYEEYRPVSLRNLTITKSDCCYFSELAHDPRENTYSNVIILYPSSWVVCYGYAEFYTGKKYTRFKCSIVPEEHFYTKELAKGEGGVIKIYADDKLIYTSDIITYRTEKIDVDIDISGTNYLLIGLDGVFNRNLYTSSLKTLICDAVVVK